MQIYFIMNIVKILIYMENCMKYKLLVLDIDGTLTNSQKQITPRTKKMLMKAQEHGVKLVIASGRPTCGVLPFAEELELKKYGGYILAFNGAKMISCADDKVIFNQQLPEGAFPEIYALAKENRVNLLTYESDTVLTETPDDPYIGIEVRINRMNLKKVDNLREYVTFPVTKCLMVGDGEYLAGVEKTVHQRLGDRLNIFRSEPFFLEIMPQNIDKAYSLNELLKTLGLSKSEMIACGDGFNDKSMIRFAGLGVAMENAQEAVKKVADFITLSNDHDGIAAVVERFIFAESF